MAVAEESQRRAVFSKLQPIMTQILPAGTNEQHMLSLLKALHTILSKDETVQKHIGLCFDYVWFPFQYILSSISATRTLSGLPSQQTSQKAALPCFASSLVAERALQCVRRILDLAQPPSLPSTLAILAQLSELTHMNRQSGNEQMMHDTLASICVLLPAVKTAKWKEHPQETRIWAVTVGMLFHGLLEVIDAERLGRGHGAPKLATAATQAAQAAVSCLVSQADRAAYYLPGLASNACAVLMEPSTRLPASCHAATCSLLQDVLILTTETSTLPKGACPAQHAEGPKAPLNAAAALTALASSLQAPAQIKATSDGAEAGKNLAGDTSTEPPKMPSDPFTTPRDAAWLRQTAESLSAMLPQALQATRVRKPTSVRSAAARLCITLLEKSAIARHQALLQPLLHTVLLLSDDSTASVSSPCMRFLCSTAASKPGAASNQLWHELTAVAEQAAQDLSSGAAWREESVLNSARLLAAALKGLPGFIPESAAVSCPARLLEVVAKLLEFDLPAAALWLQGHNGITAQGAAARSLCAQSHASATAEGCDTPEPSKRDTSAHTATQQHSTDISSDIVAVRSSVVDAWGTSEGGNAPGCEAEGSRNAWAHDATSAAARALQVLPAALQQSTDSASDRLRMPFGLKRMEQEQTFQAVASVAAATGSMCAARPSERQHDAKQSWESSSAFDAVEYVRVEMEAAGPRSSRKKVADPDHSKLVAALLRQAQLLTTLSAFLSGCASGIAAGGTLNSSAQTRKTAAAESAQTPATKASPQDSSSDCEQRSSDPSASHMFFQPLTVSLRSMARCASKVMELGAGTLGVVVASGELPAHVVATSPSVRDLSAACAVHASAVATFVEHMAVDAAPVLRHDDAMLRAVLLPLLQVAAAAGPLVAARAAAAVTALCKCRGYEGWSDLVSDNLDYVVDGLVLHIRDPTRFPHAPHLLAALLSSSAVSQALLPALAEPAAAAIQGLSILSRGLHPQRVGAFLAALTPIAAALSAQARELRKAAHSTLAELRKRKRSTQCTAAAQEQHYEQEHDDVCGRGRDEGKIPSGNSLEDEGTERGDGGFKEAAEFFAQYHKPHQIVLPKEELEELDRRRGTVYAAAELCSAITNASAPLLVAEDLKVALAAHKTAAEALTALGHLTDADDVDTRDIIEYFEVPDTAQRPGDIERVLPQVHVTWGFMLPGLRAQAQPARLSAALTLLARVSECAGSFISRRMQSDVLPHLKLIIMGSPGIATKAWLRREGAVRVVDEAPGTVARCQTLALSTLEHMCHFVNGREALSSIAGDIARVTGETLCRENTGAHVRELCAKLLKGLATVDGEAVQVALEENLAVPCPHSLRAMLQSVLDAVKVVSTGNAIHQKVIADSAPGDIESQLLDLSVA